MGIGDEKDRLERIFRSVEAWVDLQLSSAKAKSRDEAFLKTLRDYVAQSLRSLSTARKQRDLPRLERRANKATAAAISYVQRTLSERKMEDR